MEQLCTFAVVMRNLAAAALRRAAVVLADRQVQEIRMHEISDVKTMTAALDVGVARSAAETGMAKLAPLHREVLEDMPTGSRQEIRVILATLLPGDVTPHHSHRFPVTVYMTEGVFTLELDGREPIHIKAGEVFVEPAHVAMTGRNLSDETPAKMALFFVCDPDSPFADPIAD
jgi:quercetin dioxygenase-like cupin family protein